MVGKTKDIDGSMDGRMDRYVHRRKMDGLLDGWKDR